jgi:hypothetical protein
LYILYIIIYKKTIIKHDTKSYCHIRDLVNFELDYWEAAEIKKKDLDLFNVYSGKIRHDGFLWHESTENDPLFIYMFNKKTPIIVPNEDGTDIEIDDNILIPAPVDTMYMNLYTITTGNLEEAILDSTYENYLTPVVETTAPENKEEDFDIDSPIIINFNTGMNIDSVLDNMDIVPFLSGYLELIT